MGESRTAEQIAASSGHGRHDLAAWHGSMTPRERLYLAFTLSRSGAALARKGNRARSRGD